MALGLPVGGGGHRVPIIKYDARAGRISRVDRTQNGAGQWESNPVEITANFQAVMDLERIELGWLNFPANGAPEITVAPYGQPLPGKPSLQHKPGYRINMLLGKGCGGDVREMASNAQASINGMDALHTAYLAGVKSNPGKLPVVKLAGASMIVSKGKEASSTNYEPVYEIVSWVDRPAKLSAEAIEAWRTGADAPANEQAAPAEPVKQPALASVADDF
jgi:hypothetical protein